MSETEPKWSSYGGSLVYGFGTPEGRTVMRLWHDERREYEKDGEKRVGIFASLRPCEPSDPDWRQKCLDLDFVVKACNAMEGVTDPAALLREVRGNLRRIVDCDAKSLPPALRKEIAEARALLDKLPKE